MSLGGTPDHLSSSAKEVFFIEKEKKKKISSVQSRRNAKWIFDFILREAMVDLRWLWCLTTDDEIQQWELTNCSDSSCPTDANYSRDKHADSSHVHFLDNSHSIMDEPWRDRELIMMFLPTWNHGFRWASIDSARENVDDVLPKRTDPMKKM